MKPLHRDRGRLARFVECQVLGLVTCNRWSSERVA